MPNVPESQIGTVAPGLMDHAVRTAFESMAAGQLLNPPRIETLGRPGEPHYFRLEMPAMLLDERGHPLVESRKIIEESGAVDESGQRRLGARTARLELQHVPSGRSITLAAERITNHRTAAAAVWSLKWLLGDVERLAILGTGRIASEVATAADRLLRCGSIRAASRTPARCAAFLEGLPPALAARVTARADIDWALVGAEAVIAAVPAAEPLLTTERLAALRAAVAVEGDPRVSLLAPAVVADGPLVVDLVQQAEASGSLRGMDPIGYAMVAGRPATVADAAVGRLAGLAGSRPVVLLTGLAGLDLMVGWAIWRTLGPSSGGSPGSRSAWPK